MSRASACGASWRSAPCSPPAPSSGRSCSATTIAPASCLPAPCAPMSIASASLPGTRAVIFADNDDAFRTAVDLADAGVEVAALVDARRGGSAYARAKQQSKRRRAISTAPPSTRVHGRQAVKGVEIKRADGGTERIDCDLIAMSGGWNPTIHLTTHLNGKPVWSEALSALVPGKLPPGMSVVGAGRRRFRPRLMSCGRRRRPARRPPRHAASPCPPRSAPTRQGGRACGKSGLAGGYEPRQGLRRFPERRRRLRREARRARRLPHP